MAVKKKISVRDVVFGRIISHDLLVRHWKKIAVGLLLIMVYISNRYTCQQRLAEINSLERQLTDLRYESMTISSELMGSSRQSQVKELVESKGIDLEESKQPPFQLSK